MTERSGVAIGDALGSVARALTDISPTPRLDAEVLLAHVLGVDRARLVIDREVELEGLAHERFDRLARRRLAGEPVAYLTGRRGFRTLELSVDPRVLIPRPETECLVEAALEVLPHGASVLDVGTGSGAIALALAAERPDLRVAGVDVSREALAVALANRARLNLDVSFRAADLLDGSGAVDAVIANLPYVKPDADLPVDVAAFEPPLALFGGEDGLVLIRRLAGHMAARQWPTWALLEIGESQGDAVSHLLRAAGFHAVEVRPDLAGRDRVVVARRGNRAPAVAEAVGAGAGEGAQ
ncbi:MAG TPA: peptide chain release factor N(5)-glutamine methyltransferase [Solirubrobacteraceae bacterium]|nr:peptide chain release factor N(5)-glutamine methyltransferase [Solirubrobacteraceae bacterium]